VIKVSEIEITGTTTIADALAALDRAGTGILLLVNDEGLFQRTVTDGDVRRLILKEQDLRASLLALPAIQSVVVQTGASRREMLALMNEHSINHLVVVDSAGRATQLLERRAIDQQILLSTPHLGDAETCVCRGGIQY